MLSAILASLPLATACTPPGLSSLETMISWGRRNLMSMFSRNPTVRREPIRRDSTIVNL